MKIGVLACLYGNPDLLPRVMQPWIELKNAGADIVISAVHAQFKEYAELGFADEDRETLSQLESNRHIFDALHISDTPLTEAQARNIALVPLTRAEADIVWLLDGDELYTKEQILGIIDFIRKTPRFDYYHIPFKDIVFDGVHFENGFTPQRIFRTARHSGIGGFVWDNDILWGDGSIIQSLLPGEIPRSVAWVEHRTWRLEDLKKKIAYHNKHFGYCPFRIDESGTPSFDPAYFERYGMEVPTKKSAGSFESEKRTLEVIFRSHTAGSIRAGSPRVTDALGGKEELTVRSLRSVIHSLLVLSRENIVWIRLTVIDDHSSPEAIVRMLDELSVCPFDTDLIVLEGSGNSASLRAAFERAKNSDASLLYFVEDDYLHEQSALSEMFAAQSFFGRQIGAPERAAIFPVDEPDRYGEAIDPSRVVLGAKRHWRTVLKTTGTFMVSRVLLMAYWDIFTKLAEGENNETLSVNVVWQNHAVMFSPIPTLAYHMNTEERMPPFSDWKKLWDSLAV